LCHCWHSSAGWASNCCSPSSSPWEFCAARALVGALAWALIPFGGLVGGALIALVGLAPTLWLTGLAYVAATLLPLARRSFRAFGSRPGAEAA